MKTPVLDKGFVELSGFMGGDKTAVSAARASFGAEAKGGRADRKLIEFLLSNGHLTPFEHSVFRFRVKCPIFSARQWMRHRWGSFSELSGRYAEAKEEFYVPSAFRLRAKSCGAQAELLKEYSASVSASYGCYRRLLSAGVAREQARLALPVSLYTVFYWTVNARSLMNFLALRLDGHAQAETRAYASAISAMFRLKMPATWRAFEKLFLAAPGRKFPEAGLKADWT